MTMMDGAIHAEATRSVGVHLTTRTVVMAVMRPGPLRLVALASLAWPLSLWRPAPAKAAMSTAHKALTQARRRLGLPRWCAVSVTADASLAAPGLSALSATLFARAGLPQVWMIAPDRAVALSSTVDMSMDPHLAPMAVGRQVQLAMGAALATLLPPAAARTGSGPIMTGPTRLNRPPDNGSGEPPDAPPHGPDDAAVDPDDPFAGTNSIDQRQWEVTSTAGPGWMVQRMDVTSGDGGHDHVGGTGPDLGEPMVAHTRAARSWRRGSEEA